MVPFFFNLPSLAAFEPADTVLEDTFTLQNVTATQPRRPDGGFDWDWRGPRDDPEWAWFFNRHDWFVPLLRGYEGTGNDAYAVFLLDALDDWIMTHPVPRGFTISSAWRPLEAARRLLGSWLEIKTVLGDHPAFTPERKARFHESLRDHGQHLRDHHVFFGNHLVTEVLALTLLSLAYPDFPESSEWLAYGLAQLDEAYAKQVYPDGAHTELSTHYQRVVALNFQKLYQSLRYHEKHALADEWAPRVLRMWQYMAGVMKPDGSNPINNDSDWEDISLLLQRFAPELMEMEPVSFHFPWAGQKVFRSRTAEGPILWAWFDAGPRGTDHDHDDPLHFSLSVGEAAFLVDNGRYTYAPGPFRRYFSGPEGHNLLLMNGQSASSGPRQVSGPNALLRAHTFENGFEIAWGSRSFRLPGQRRAGDWQRSVLHLPGRGFIVFDSVITFAPREISTLWHWAPEVFIPGTARPPFVATHNETPLDVRFLTSSHGTPQWEWFKGQEFPRPQGWYSPTFNVRLPAPALILTQKVDRPLLNVWIFQIPDALSVEVTVLSPWEVEINDRDSPPFRLNLHALPKQPSAWQP